ncbi:hypothetical protein M5K25_001047 [Dendrobium thyrsiflorum]|uniref:Uncharacterized protein n=1 Tax=Dendrobium thyrsiflorum TaxID=117978 RepID=A0ABD0VYN7_DENTH
MEGGRGYREEKVVEGAERRQRFCGALSVEAKKSEWELCSHFNNAKRQPSGTSACERYDKLAPFADEMITVSAARTGFSAEDRDGQ